MMKRFGEFCITLLFILMLTSGFVPLATANASPVIKDNSIFLLSGKTGIAAHQADESNPTEPGARVISNDSNGLTIEVNVPWEQLTLEEVTVGDSQYIRVSLPGYAQTGEPGAPALPFLTRQIGAPFGVGVDMQVIPGPGHTQVLSLPVLPVVTQQIDAGAPDDDPGAGVLPESTFMYQKDPAVYVSGGGYPGELAKVTSDGILRQQRVVGINAYPVQYQPGNRELTVYESMRIVLTFSGARSSNSRAAVPESDAYESLLQRELLNYETARQWRQPADLDLLSASSGFDMGLKTASIPWAPPNPGWRVKVREDGFYKLTYTELADAGLPVDTLDPRTFEIYNLGVPVAIQVQGEADGHFEPSDSILFYGQKLASKYTRDNVYWLTYGETGVTRIAERVGTPGTAATPDHYSAVQNFEENTYYLSQSPGNDNLDRWLWDYIYPNANLVPKSWTYTFQLNSPYASTATLRLKMLGFLANAINPDHHVIVSLNGQQVGDTTWDGKTWRDLEMTIPAGVLIASPGVNTLVVKCPNDTGVGIDLVYIDGFELDYSKTFAAENNTLAFTYADAGTWKYQVTGFTTDAGLAVFDVTNPAAVVQITNPVVSAVSPYSLQFEDTVAGSTSYWTTTASNYLQVQGIVADTASSLGATGNGADHIAIAHHDFLTQSQSLSDFRVSQGLRAVTVDVQDVYDEFNYGIVSPGAIHDFLAYAYTSWQAPAPAFVVLVGDGHYDPKDYLGFGRTSYIPPYLTFTDPWIGETAADNRYVTLAGDDSLADMMLGRLAVNNADEASAFITKIINYEKTPVGGDWQRQVLAVADNADGAGDFALASDELLSDLLPTSYQAQKVYYGVTPYTIPSAAQAAILDGINAGKLIVNYIGHGAVNSWASEKLFKSTDVAGLVNGSMLPVILPMTCMDGYYHYPYQSTMGLDSTAEVITRAAGKGAVASWSPTGFGVSTGHDYLNRGFFEALFQDGITTFGGATATGKLDLFTAGFSLDLLETYLLFGDPASNFPIAVPEPLTPSGTITTSNPKFTWKLAVDATKYKLLIKQGDTQIKEEEITAFTCGTSTCSFTFPASLNLVNGDYTWTVKAYFGFWGGYGESKSFTIAIAPVTEPLTPSGIITTRNPKFTWKLVVDATKYKLLIKQGDTQIMEEEITAFTCGTSTCSYTFPTNLNLQNGEYSWTVKAYFGFWGGYGESKSFTVAKAPVPRFPKISSTSPNPKFIWTKVADQTKYKFILYNSSNEVVLTQLISTPVCGTTTCSFTPDPALGLVNGAYKWKIQSYNGMWGWFSALKSFEKVDPPAPVSPSGNIYNANPTFKWVKIPGATQYYLILQTSTGAAVKSLEIKSPACLGTICSYTPSPAFDLAKGNYKWKIRAYNGYYGPYSVFMAFTRN